MKAISSYLPFNSTEELKTIAGQLDMAETTPLFFRDSDGELKEVAGSKGVINSSQGYYVATVSDGYTLLQNSEMIETLATAMDALEITPVGKVINSYDKVSVEIHFPQFAIEEADHNLPIYMGTRILNSYNKSTGFRGHGFLHRQWCKNGAYASYALPEMRFSEVHRGDLPERTEIILGEYMATMEKGQKVIGQILGTAAQYKMFFDAPDQIMVTLGEWAGSKRAGAEIYDCLLKEVPADELEVSRYDLWNAFTRFASHKEGLSVNVKDRMNKVAESLLYPQALFAPVDDWEKKLKTPKTPKEKKTRGKKTAEDEDIIDAEFVEMPAI